MPAQQPEHVDVPFYAQIAPRWEDWRHDAAGNPILEGARCVALTQEKPKKPRPGVVVTKLTLRFPAGAFLPLSPEAVVVIPADLTVTTPLEVTAFHPGDVADEGDEPDPVVAP